MSNIAGRLALKDALQHYHGTLPIKVTVLVTGPAGLSAAYAAKDKQLHVQLFGRQERYSKEADEAGIMYHVLPETDQTIIIAAARAIGKRRPLLINEASLTVLPEK